MRLPGNAKTSALRESEVRLHLAASSAEVGLWILDFGTGHFWATDKARELFGYAKEQEINFETIPEYGPSR